MSGYRYTLVGHAHKGMLVEVRVQSFISEDDIEQAICSYGAFLSKIKLFFLNSRQKGKLFVPLRTHIKGYDNSYI